jgi:uncharacterized repeat protein (TIGR01451 family)
MLTKPQSQLQALFSLTRKQKLVFILLSAILVSIPVWLSVERVQSAPAEDTNPPIATTAPPLGQTPNVTLDVPDEVLIGDQFKFTVTFTPGTAVGYGPFIDLVLPAGGIDYNDPGGPCDGVTYVPGSAQMIGVNGGPIPVTTDVISAPCQHTIAGACATLPHPYGANGISSATVPSILVPEGAQLVTIKLPFGSFQTNQPPIVIQLTAKLSGLADVNAPLNIHARAGYQFGSDPLNLPLLDPPPTLLSPGGVTDCTTWTASAPLTPVLFTFKVEDPLTNPGPCYDGIDNGSDNLTDSKDPDCQHAKTYVGPEDETATGPNYPRQYKIILNIAAGQTVTNLTIQDCLPNNIVFTGIGAGTSPPPIPPPPSPSGPLNNNCLSFNYPSIVGTPSTTEVVIFVKFYVPQNDANGNPVLDPATCTNATSPNDVKASANWTPTDLRDPATTVTSDAAQVDHLLTDKRLAIQKSYQIMPSPPGVFRPGKVVRYTLDFQVSDFFTVGEIIVDDVLSDGQDVIGSPTLTVRDRRKPVPTTLPFSTGTFGPSFSNAQDPNVNCGGVQGGRKLVFRVSTAMKNNASLFIPPPLKQGILTGGHAFLLTSNVPATGQIIFFVQIRDQFIYPRLPRDQAVDKHDPINNCVLISADIFTNNPVAPVTKGFRCKDDSTTLLTLPGDVLEKKIVARNGSTTDPQLIPNPPRFTAGDTITFRIRKTLPSGDYEKLTIEDWFPLPVLPLTGGMILDPLLCPIVMPASGHICRGAGHTLNVIPTLSINPNNSLTLDYGSHDETNNLPKTIELFVTLTVSSDPYADGLFLTNEARECELNTFGVQFCQVAVARFELTEPNVRIRKGVIATNNPNSVFTAFPNHLPPGKSVAALTTMGPAGGPPIWAPLAPWITSVPALANPNVFNSDLNNADANDWITFAIVLENRGSGLHGAFGVRVKDTPHPAFVAPGTSWNVRGHDGRGAPFTLMPPVGPPGVLALMTAAGKLLQDPGPPPILFDPGSLDHFSPSSGRNLAIITYNMQLRPASQITMGQCFTNTAELISYAATAGGPNFVSAGFTPPFTDIARVCINPTLEKSVVATSEAHTTPQTSTTPQTPPNTPKVAIGEIVRYRLVVRLPEGNGPNFKVTDALAPGMKFMNDNTARLAFISTGGTGITHPFGPAFNVGGNQPSTPTQPIPGNAISGGVACGAPVTFDLGNIQNNDNDPDLEYVVIEFNALVCNVPSNLTGTTLPDTFSVSVNGAQIATSNPINVTVVEPRLVVNKIFTPANPAAPASFTLTITNTGTTDAFNVHLTDTLPPGLTLSAIPAPSVSVSPSACAAPQLTISGNTLTVDVPKLPNSPSCAVTLKFYVQGQFCGTNTAQVTYSSLPGGLYSNPATPVGTRPNPTGSVTDCSMPNKEDCERIYSTSAQVNSPTNCHGCTNQVSQTPGMVGWWPLDEKNGATAVNDLAGFNNQGVPKPTTPVGVAGAPIAVPGAVGGAMNFDANLQQSGPYVEVPDHPEINFGSGNFTIDTWVLVQKPPAVYLHPIVDKLAMNPAGTQGSGYALYLVSSFGTGAQLQFVMGTGGPLVGYSGPNVPSVPFGTWTHITLTVNRTSGIAVFHVNGLPVTTTGGPMPGGSTDNTVPLLIGESRLPGPHHAAITLDELEMFKRVLTTTDIQSIVNAFGFGKCKCWVASNEAISCNSNGTFSYTVTLTNVSSSPVSTVVFSSVSSVTITPNTISIPPLPSGGSTTVTVTIGGPAAVSGANLCFFVGLTGVPPAPGCRAQKCITLPACQMACAAQPGNMVSWWRLDEQNGATVVTDIKGGHNGTPLVSGSPGPVTNAQPGKVGGSFFIGNNVSVPDDPSLKFGTGSFSIDAWFGSGQPALIGGIVDKLDIAAKKGYALYIQNDHLRLVMGNGTSFVTYPSIAPVGLVSGVSTWHHVAVTVDRTNAKAIFYIDGVPGPAFPILPASIDISTSSTLFIGGSRQTFGTSCVCEYLLDEVEIFNSVISVGEVQSIFQAGPSGKCP